MRAGQGTEGSAADQEQTMTIETVGNDESFSTLSVRCKIDPSEIGPRQGRAAAWRARVIAVIHGAIESHLREQYPSASLEIKVSMGRSGYGSLVVESEGEPLDELECDLIDAAAEAIEKAGLQ